MSEKPARVRKKSPKVDENTYPWHELFRYDSGNLYWLQDRPKGPRAGDLVGGPTKKTGHHRFALGENQYQTYRIIWVLHNGPIAEGMWLDHIDRNPLNNRIENLRVVTPSQNSLNRSTSGESGYKGVFKITRNKLRPWGVRFLADGELYNLCGFKTAEDAAIVYDALALKYFKEFAVLNFPKETK